MTSPEMLINMKSLPDEKSSEYDDFWQNEVKKIDHGITINGVYIHGWLYWHLNHWKIYKDYQESVNKTTKRVFSRPDARDNEWIVQEGLIKAETNKNGLMIFGARRLAKELLDSSLLYKENGEITIGNAKIGDKIYGADGKLTTIIGVYPQGKVPIYKMTLRDNREIFCGLEHNWFVFDKYKNQYVVKTTKDLLKGYSHKRIHNGYKDKITRNITEERYFIPNNKPVQYSEKELPIDPYFLGLWLGDGNSRSLGITSIDQPIIDYVYKIANDNDLSVYYDKPYTYIITTGNRGGNKDKNKLWNKFKQLNLPLNKHIPDEYLYSSIDQRLALLQGLMDTDGTYSNGTIALTSKSEKLINNIYKLCRSLGINCKTTIKKSGYKKNGVRIETGEIFYIRLYTDLPVFKLNRKLEKIHIDNKGHKSKIEKTAIVDISYVYDDYATCIRVDNEDHLFLTDNYTVTHNSEIAASYIGRSATIFEGSENVVTGGNWPDINLITDKIDKGLSSLHPYLRHGRLSSDFKKEIGLGFKDKKGNRFPWSKILVRNFENGQNPEAAAGITAMSFFSDEVGKYPFLESFLASIPCFASPFGWRCVPILTGTSGLIEPNSDAQKVFENPDAYNFVSFELKDEGGKKVSMFIPGTRRMEAKYKTKFGNFIENEKGILLPKDSELFNVEFWDSDLKKGLEICEGEQEVAKTSKDSTALIKAKMYYPTNTGDLFITISDNKFPIDAAKEVLSYIETQENNICEYITLYKDVDAKVKYRFSEKRPIQNWPAEDTEDKDAPVVMYEPPMDNAPYGLYIAGGDPYNQSESSSSTSLGTIYIYKRFYDPIDGVFQRTMVASYASRTKTISEWYSKVEMLLELYNATLMIENADRGIIQYLDQKHKSYLLADGFNLLKEISPNTKIQGRDKGLPPTIPVINHSMGLLYDYCNEEITIGYNEDKTPIIKLGIFRIKDKMLLKEMIGYQKGANVDRIVAFRHVLVYEQWMDKMIPNVDVRQPAKQETTTKKKPYTSSPFGKGGSNPFGFTGLNNQNQVPFFGNRK